MSVVPTDGLWDEDGTRLWLPHDSGTRGQVRYRAWTGRGLPIGFREMGADLIDLRVRVAYARFDPDYDQDDWPWKRTTKDDAAAVKVWEIE